MIVLVVATLVAVSTWLAWPGPVDDRLRRVGLVTRAVDSRLTATAVLTRMGERIAVGPWHRRRRAAARMRLIEAVGALAAELDAGQTPDAALQRSAGVPPAWPTTLAAIELHAPVPAALRLDAEGAAVGQQALLRSIAACWEAAEISGSGLSTAVGRLAVTARRAEETRVQLEGELAAPRATARLLAGLPAFGVLIGFALGVDPFGWLLGGPIGWACLMAAIALIVLGMAWTGRIAAAVERQL
ncbi:MAG: type II secretion system F family protein [Actinomycetales bacterium]